MSYTIEEIKEILMEHYDIEEDDTYSMESGCYINRQWLSIQEILDILDRGY